ncbi:MAG: ATP-binding protein [Oscillospiraceae bacterium]|nr:ATP-binding protein [Oscillospiraceae bacterium]
MAQSLHFSASTSVKNLFGRGLVTDQVAAVFELVKNSYDADARKVEIVFSDLNTDKATLTIRDTGTGMDLDDIEQRWMVIGTDSKKNTLYSPIFHRPLNGDKGIGRFSVDRLGAFLHMEAQKMGSSDRYIADFDWSLFDGESKNISDIAIPYAQVKADKKAHGVSLTISKLRDVWDEQKLRELYRNLRQFKSPFAQDDNFKIFITAPEYGYNKREVVVEKLEGVSSLWMIAEISANDPEKIRITVNKDGLEYESIQTNPFSFGSVKAQVFMFNQGDKVRFANRYGLRVREYGNIRLYRDSFRIYPYGEAKNDWLDLDRRQTQGLMRFLGSRDLIGYVQIGKESNPNLIPLTNRQGLEENTAFEELRNFVMQVCIKTLESYYFTKVKKGTNETIQKSKVQIGGAVAGLTELAKVLKDANPDAAKQIKDYTSVIQKEQKNQLQFVQDQQEIVKVYSRIAQKETFLHKMIHQSMIHVKDAEVAMNAFIRNAEDMEPAEAAKLRAIHGYIKDALSLLRTVRDDVVKKRTKSPQDLERLTQRYLQDNNAYFSENSVTVSAVCVGNMQCVVDPGDIKAILNNLATNAVKSLVKVSDRPRELRFELYRTDRFVIIKCIDNGIGIPEVDRERIFDPFQSTTDGFGLGLTIIDEIAKEYNGALELIDTAVGACFSVKMRC